MKITKVETIMLPENPRYLWVRIHTDEGLVGLGETYVHAEPVKAIVEDVFAREFLLGKDALQIEAIWRSLFDRVNYVGWAGAEIRAISAIDIALWDILGQACAQPLYQLLGGACRKLIPVYNTCGGEPGFDFLVNPVDYAADLLASGICALKIWPFDRFAEANGGHLISLPELKKAIQPIHMIRR
jgi:L-alanine-DL-glutamate epimerase-like enolase superfamily enzyme